MVMRCSFTLDSDMLEQIDQCARDNAIDRNAAILELIEAGLVCRKDGSTLPVRQQRSFEELNQLRRGLDDVREALTELRSEVRLVHHTIETDWIKGTKAFRSRRSTPGSSGESDLLHVSA